MRRIAAVLVFIAMAVGIAAADPYPVVNLKIERFDGPSAGGANSGYGVYVYPYYFSVDGSQYPDLLALLCDSYDNEVWKNETWQAHVIPITAFFAGTNGDKYKEAAWLMSNMGIHPSPADAVAYNFAIWGLFSTNALNSAGYASSGAGNAISDAGPIPMGFDFSGYSVYVPIAGTQMLNGNRVSQTPQEYIGYSRPVPEPASLATLGTGLFTVCGFIRRRIIK